MNHADKIHSLFWPFAILALSGCAHEATERRLNERLAETPTISSRSDLNALGERTLQSTKDLTDGEKAVLRKVHRDYLDENSRIETESRKLRSILIKDVIASNYDRDEVALIEARLTQLEDRRVSALMKAIRQANQILGHWESGGQRQLYDFISEAYLNQAIF